MKHEKKFPSATRQKQYSVGARIALDDGDLVLYIQADAVVREKQRAIGMVRAQYVAQEQAAFAEYMRAQQDLQSVMEAIAKKNGLPLENAERWEFDVAKGTAERKA